MTEESLLLVREIREKIRLVFDEFAKLEKGNDLLRQEMDTLKARIGQLEKEKAELGTRNENLSLAKSFEAGYGDNKLARQKVNKLLREIDKCVALLNG